MFRTLAIALLATSLSFCSPARSADKGGPPVKVDVAGNVKPAFSGCYVGGSAGGAFMSDAFGSFNTALAGVEVGCDLTNSNVVFGARGGYDFGETDARFARLGLRAGFRPNQSAVLYGLLDLTMDGRSPKLDNASLAAGLGLEMMAFTPKTSIFIEGSKDLKAFGDATGVTDAWLFRAGARYRF